MAIRSGISDRPVLLLSEHRQRLDARGAARAGHGRVFIGLEADQSDALQRHIEEKRIPTKKVEWGKPTLVIRDLDENELYFWLTRNEAAVDSKDRRV